MAKRQRKKSQKKVNVTRTSVTRIYGETGSSNEGNVYMEDLFRKKSTDDRHCLRVGNHVLIVCHNVVVYNVV